MLGGVSPNWREVGVSEDSLGISAVENEVGVPVGSFGSLLKEDSWSFVIKLHAFFEGLLSNLLAQSLHREELRDAFSYLELSNSRSGKLVFAQKMNLLDKPSITFIRSLSELRNSLVHDPRNVTFNMNEYVHEMDANQRKSFKKRFGTAFSDEENDQRELDTLLDGKPQAVLYLGALKIVYNLSLKRLGAKIAFLEKERGQLLLRLYEAKAT
jgi:hypothetical protein